MTYDCKLPGDCDYPCACPMVVNCDACQTEGRILTNDGGPDDVDHGVCPACNGERVFWVDALPIGLEDLDEYAPVFRC